ncbi:hypothetical protein P7C70_g5751, partial [Phenoliferia sp. Uapishka_3]
MLPYTLGTYAPNTAQQPPRVEPKLKRHGSLSSLSLLSKFAPSMRSTTTPSVSSLASLPPSTTAVGTILESADPPRDRPKPRGTPKAKRKMRSAFTRFKSAFKEVTGAPEIRLKTRRGKVRGAGVEVRGAGEHELENEIGATTVEASLEALPPSLHERTPTPPCTPAKRRTAPVLSASSRKKIINRSRPRHLSVDENISPEFRSKGGSNVKSTAKAPEPAETPMKSSDNWLGELGSSPKIPPLVTPFAARYRRERREASLPPMNCVGTDEPQGNDPVDSENEAIEESFELEDSYWSSSDSQYSQESDDDHHEVAETMESPSRPPSLSPSSSSSSSGSQIFPTRSNSNTPSTYPVLNAIMSPPNRENSPMTTPPERHDEQWTRSSREPEEDGDSASDHQISNILKELLLEEEEVGGQRFADACELFER